MRKTRVLGVIILFLNVTLTSVISSQTLDESIKLIEIKVREYNGDGTYIEKIKKIPMDVAEKLKETNDFDRKLSILKEYNLVSKDASVEKYRNEIQELAQQTGLTEEKMKQISKNIKSLNYLNPRFVFNVLCKVELWTLGIIIPFGLSVIIWPLNLLLMIITEQYIPIPSIDLAIISTGPMIYETNGLLGDQSSMNGWLIFTIGFVGIDVWLMFDERSIHGFSLMTAGF